MHVLVVHAHPLPDSFGASLLAATRRGLARGHHEVRIHPLYEDGFRPAMSDEERVAYHTDQPLLDPRAAAYAEDVRWADAIVFVYPTWWAGLPAILKGWFDRVLVNSVAFHHVALPQGGHTIEPALRHLRVIAGVTTYGSPRWFVRATGDAGRRTVLRALWVSTGARTRRRWLGCYGVDGATEQQRAAFVAKVERRMERL